MGPRGFGAYEECQRRKAPAAEARLNPVGPVRDSVCGFRVYGLGSGFWL